MLKHRSDTMDSHVENENLVLSLSQVFLSDTPTDSSVFWADSILTECDFQGSNDKKTGNKLYPSVALF